MALLISSISIHVIVYTGFRRIPVSEITETAVGAGMPDDTTAVLRATVLGPVRAWCHDHELELGQSRQQALFAVLAMRANDLVSLGQLIDAIWDPDPPESARAAVYTYVAGLRRALEPGRERRAPGRVLVSAGPGYVLRLEPGELDANIFERHLATARRLRDAGNLRRAASELEAAVTLCRGIPLAGISGPFAEAQRSRLKELRMSAAEDRAEVLLALGRQEETAAELAGLVRQHPLRERMRGLLMLALYRCGRQAEALEIFRSTRQLLAEELGIDPSPVLRQLHQQILTGEPALLLTAPLGADNTGDTSMASIRAMKAGDQAPAQLPRDLPCFTGRLAELDKLRLLLTAAGASQMGTAAPIVVISGTAGVGKTALAVHFARQGADRFPDGQLYANLRGFDPAASPVPSAEALSLFLTALDAAPDTIPGSEDARAALYRSLLNGKRLLVLLDNARDASHVRPLLPGSPGCLVIITSRCQLTGLIATEGAHPLVLNVLAEDEARDLLARRLGADRLDREPSAGYELATLCARLPLALAIVAARAAGRPGLALAELAAELRDRHRRLDALEAGDPATDVRAVFSWSYEELSAPCARLFRLLGLHPGPDITPAAAASLAAIPASQARRLLGELARAHLLTEHVPGRFTFHDLLRAYAAEQARTRHSDTERRAATHRLLDHYLHTAGAASRPASPAR
jgi:DNA-binding SARP family transcriptional activator